MLFGEKETDIIEYIQSLDVSEMSTASESDKAIGVLEKIHSKELWENWVNSSSKSDPPPDFYSDNYKLMIDVMRVNDTERKGKKGKLFNSTIKHERKMYRELIDSGITQKLPNAKVFTIGDCNLSTYEDHSYAFYKKNFSRVINKHIESIPLYQRNHANYKTIFIIFDESTAYMQLQENISSKKQLKQGEQVLCTPHLFFYDSYFLECFYNKGIDYIIWLTPYKLIQTLDEPLIMPRLILYDLSIDKPETIEYNEDRIISSEI